MFQENKIEKLTRIEDLPDKFSECTKCLFSDDSKTIFLVKRDKSIDVFKVSPTDSEDIVIDYRETIRTEKLTAPISHIVASHCGTYLVCADICCNITVWRRTKRSWVHHINLPKYLLSPTAIAIHPNAPKLVVAFSDSKLFEYHLEEMKFLCSTTKYFVENQKTHVIRNIILDSRNENIFILQNDTDLFVLKKLEVNTHFSFIHYVSSIRFTNRYYFNLT